MRIMSIMIKPIGRLSANNAAFNWMNAANSLTNLTNSNMDSRSKISFEKRLTADMLNDSLMYKASLLQEESMDKVRKENIKRTFSTFA